MAKIAKHPRDRRRRRHAVGGILFAAWVCLLTAAIHARALGGCFVLNPTTFSNYVAHFNSMEDENVTNYISNAKSWEWLQKEIPFFECPDHEIEEMYYYRWWSFRKHIE